MKLAPEKASRLAYYKAAHNLGVRAPRGWYCFGVYGSSGGALYVGPQPMNFTNVVSRDWSGFAGPLIEIAFSYGTTSGRFEVARVIARVFPAHRKFVRDVIRKGFEPPSYFPFGPYPKDRLSYKSKEVVEYETPALTEGLGTNSMLKRNSHPITGVAMLIDPEPDLLLLSVRLPQDMNDLCPVIIRQVERDVQLGHRCRR